MMIKNTFSTETEASARYWIVQYVPDLFRQESRNVGVIVERAGQFQARFIGEAGDPGEFDNRTLRFVKHPKVYKHWVKYYRRLMERQDVELLESPHDGNYRLLSAGFIDQTNQDSLDAVCAYAYSTLVSAGGLNEALQEDQEATEATQALKDALTRTFRSEGLLGTATGLFSRHPIYVDRSVPGRTAHHEFSFIQPHATLDVIEPLNFLSRQKRNLRDRSGWLAYAINDVRANRSCDLNAYVVVELPATADEATTYCLDLLKDVAHIVDWSEESKRKRFVKERIAIAAGEVD